MNEKQVKSGVKHLLTSNPSPFPSWDPKLFTKPTDEITEYLLNIYNTTLDEIEYYTAMSFLVGMISKDQLYIPFNESDQYLEMIGDNDFALPVVKI